MTDRPLRRFWIEFEIAWDEPCPRGVREGVGVTAVDVEDARSIVGDTLFGGGPMPPIRGWAEDPTIADLCPWIVAPNMSDWTQRGIWFPIVETRRTTAGGADTRI